MRIHRILCLCVAMVVPQLALAQVPFTNETFGKLEGTLAFCGQINSRAAAKYKEQAKLLVRETPEKDVTKARNTQEYKEAYDRAGTELGKMSRVQAVEACSSFLDPKKGELPFTNETFGKLEGTLAFCGQVNPQAAATYKEQAKLLIRDIPENDVAEVRKTTEYKEAYDWVGAELGKMPKAQAIEACTSFLETKK